MSDIKIIIAKLDKLDSRIDNIDITLAKQEVSLAEHMRRSAMLEEQMRPVQRHVLMIEGVLKFIGLIALIAGIYSSIVK